MEVRCEVRMVKVMGRNVGYVWELLWRKETKGWMEGAKG